ncbi:MAG: ExbD/TolR family protein [Rubripirellula sp.]
MSIRRNDSAEEATINLTPMIDVVFLLVIFFMVGSKFSEAESRIDVNVPSVGDLRSITRVPDERVVTVDVNGVVALDGTPMSLPQLTETLRIQHANYPALQVALKADENVTHGTTVQVMHAMRSSGVSQIGISTRMQR